MLRCWAVVVSGSFCVFAQDAVVRGVVEDRSGAPVKDAKVRLGAGESFAPRRATSATDGSFEFARVPAGDYVLTVSAKDLEEVTVPVKTGAGAPESLRLRLAPASLSQSVSVSDTAGGPVSASENTDFVRLSEGLLGDLPVKEGNLGAIPSLFLDPAVQSGAGPQVVVDGMEGGNLDVPPTTVKRMYVNKNPYSAEFSQQGRGRIEIVTRGSSRSRVHRQVSVASRNSALDARNAFATERPPLNRVTVEGGMDGPLAGEKLGFLTTVRYYNYEDYSVLRAQTPAGPVSGNASTPSHGLRALGRLDYSHSPLHRFSVMYKFRDEHRENLGVGGVNLTGRGANLDGAEHRVTLLANSILTPALTNELRASFKNEEEAAVSRISAPAILVLDAFNAGGAQRDSDNRERSVEFSDTAAISRGDHLVRFGGAVRLRRLTVRDAANFGGTLTYSSLAAFSANRPFVYAINSGNPSAAFPQDEYSAFVQDEWRLRRNLSASLGLRYEAQSDLADYSNAALRTALAWAPSGSTVIRAGGGLFYDRRSASMLQQSLLYDGVHIVQRVVNDPAGSAQETNVPPSGYRLDPGLRSPALVHTSAGIEQRIGRRQALAAEYAFLRGSGLFRLRNINAPKPASGLRPDPAWLNVNQFESSGQSRGHSVRFTYQTQWGGHLRLFAAYTWSRTDDNTSSPFQLPADNYNLRPEWGRSDFDRRHRFQVIGTLGLPWQFKLGTVLALSSGAPFNITTGRDDNGDSAALDRPAGVTRNTGQGPGYANLDLRLSKKLYRGERPRFRPEISADAYNVLNRVNPAAFVGTLTSPFFGLPTIALPARQIMLTLNVRF